MSMQVCNTGISSLGMHWWLAKLLSEIYRVKASPNLQRKVSLVQCSYYCYAVIIQFVSSDIWLLSSGMNRQLSVAGIPIHECFSVHWVFVWILDVVSHFLFLLSLVGMGAPVAYYNNRHLLMIQFVQKQNYNIASLHSRTLQCHTNMTELTPQWWHQKKHVISFSSKCGHPVV